MKITTKTLTAIIAIMVIALSSCHQTPKFKVKGQVSGAADQTLYFEHQDLEGITILDSVKLGSNGNFTFKEKVPKYPDFYRLRLGKQTIPFAIDSVATLQFNADAQSFATSYSVTGSKSADEIKDLWLAQLDANVQTSKLIQSYNKGHIQMQELQTETQKVVNKYKDLANKYIFRDPQSPVAYFALFQQIDGVLIYNIYNKEDSRAYAAVATSYDVMYPNSPRSKHLHKLAIKSISIIRAQEAAQRTINNDSTSVNQASTQGVGQVLKDVKQIGYIDINLPNIKGDTIALSKVADGHVTLVSFTSFAANWSNVFGESLRTLYDRYHSKGLQIYQIGLDTDLHIWKNAVMNQPWYNVHDHNGFYSPLIGTYNITELPTLYVINKDGIIAKKFDSMDALNAWLKRSL